MAYEAKMARFLGVISALTLAVMSACSDDDDSSIGVTGGAGGTDAGAGSGGEDGSTAGSGGTGGSGGAMPEGAAGPEVFTCTMDADGGPGMCNYMCEGACTVECLGGRCTADCPAGGCTHDADFEAVAAYTCEGGGCHTDCDNASDCTVNCTGGGCDVTCDVASKCNVDCPESAGAACDITCVEGGTATCTAGSNCTFNNCMACDPTPDPSYMPAIDPADFSTTIDNPLFPLPVGATWVYNAPDEVITVTVTDMTYTVAMGVECVVVHDQVCSTNSDLIADGCDGVGGDLIEDTLDWYAQDSAGNVWYFGEETTEYVNGVAANTRGAWEAGVDGALPGIIMNADIRQQDVGSTYRQEYLVCQAEDEGEIMAIDESVTVPTGTYTGCVRIRDFSRLDPTSNEYKTFCPGVGVALVTDVATGERLEELNMVSGL